MIQPNYASFFQQVGAKRAVDELGQAFASKRDEGPVLGLTSRISKCFPKGQVVWSLIDFAAQDHYRFGSPICVD
jgi:hypothetical protein